MGWHGSHLCDLWLGKYGAVGILWFKRKVERELRIVCETGHLSCHVKPTLLSHSQTLKDLLSAFWVFFSATHSNLVSLPGARGSALTPRRLQRAFVHAGGFCVIAAAWRKRPLCPGLAFLSLRLGVYSLNRAEMSCCYPTGLGMCPCGSQCSWRPEWRAPRVLAAAVRQLCFGSVVPAIFGKHTLASFCI